MAVAKEQIRQIISENNINSVADGISKGKILAKKEDTIALSKLGLPVEQIASALQIDIEIARQWIRDE